MSIEVLFSGALNIFFKGASENEIDVKFVEYPHDSVAGGFLGGAGTWSAGNLIVYDNLVENSYDESDTVQNALFSHGLYIPEHNSDSKNIHIFSRREVVKCLSDTQILFIGDINIALLLVGLRDILFEDISITDISNVLEYASMSAEEISVGFARDGIDVEFAFAECYLEGLSCYIDAFSSDINVWSDSDAVIMNVLYQQFISVDYSSSDMEAYTNELTELFKYCRKKSIPLTWATSVHYSIDLPPTVSSDWSKYYSEEEFEYLNLVAVGLGEKYGVPIFDVESITYTCQWDNCTSTETATTSSRFVNRMKVQLLLNNLCSY